MQLDINHLLNAYEIEHVKLLRRATIAEADGVLLRAEIERLRAQLEDRDPKE